MFLKHIDVTTKQINVFFFRCGDSKKYKVFGVSQPFRLLTMLFSCLFFLQAVVNVFF